MSDYSWVEMPKFDYTTAYREHGNGVYLADGETFESVVSEDALILEDHGLTHQEVGESLISLFGTVNTFLTKRAPRVEEPVPDVILTKCGMFTEYERCPYLPGVSAGFDWAVYTKNVANGNKAIHPENGPTFVSPMVPEMIKQLGFFEGTVYYGIKPEWAVAIHKLMEEYAPEHYEPTYTVDAWDSVSWFHRFMSRVSSDIMENSAATEEFLPGVTAYIAPGSIAPFGWDSYNGTPQFVSRHDGGADRKTETWTTFTVHKDTRLEPDTALGGMLFGSDSNPELKAGNTYYARHFPHYEKQVA